MVDQAAPEGELIREEASPLDFLQKDLADKIVSQTESYIDKLPFSRENDLLVKSLWRSVETVFVQGGELVINLGDEQIETGLKFQENKLLAHNVFHIAKVVQLTAEMGANWLKTKYQTDEQISATDLENVFCLMMGAIVHDLAQLKRVGEEQSQELLYAGHPLRAVGLAKQIIEQLVERGQIKQDRKQAIINKISLFITATDTRVENPYDETPLMIDWLEQGNTKKTPLQNGISRFQEDEPFLREVGGCLNALPPEEREEIKDLTWLIMAADYGSYLCDPTAPIESIKLWSEARRVIKKEDGSLVSAAEVYKYPNETLAGFLKPDFLNQVEAAYGEKLDEYLNSEGDWQNYRQQARQRRESLRQKIVDNGMVDAFRHLEGSISRAALLRIIKKQGIPISPALEEALLEESIKPEGTGVGQPTLSLDLLSTKVIRILYQQLERKEQREAILKEIFTFCLKEAKSEGVSSTQFAFAPAAYAKEQSVASLQETTEEFIKAFELAKQETEQTETGLVFCFRQDGWEFDNRLELVAFINEKYKDGFIAGVNFGSKVEDFAKIDDFGNQLLEKHIPLSVHLGQTPEKLEENFRVFKHWAEKGAELIVDDYSAEVFKLLKETQKVGEEQPGAGIKIIITDLLRFLLSEDYRPRDHPIWQLWEIPGLEVKVASINPSLEGDVGYAIEEWLRELYLSQGRELNP